MKRKKTIRKAKVKDKSAATDRRFIEIVNWKMAQCMSKVNAPWMKLYTSLLDNDAFGNLDDESRMLIIGLWLYSARVGHHVFLADPRWLRRKIPMLNTDPNLDPLLEAADDRGCPTPFLRYCGPPGTDRPSRAGARDAGGRARARGEESRGEQTGDGREEKKREKKRRAEESRGEQSRAEQNRAEPGEKTASQGTVDQKTSEPADPSKPDQGQAQAARAAQPAPGLSSQPQPDRGRRSLSSAGEYDIHDIAVGRRVHRALHLLSDPDEGDGYSEVCSFASVLHGIMQLHARSPPEFRDRLGMRLLKLAGKIAKSKAARNKSRVWISKAREIAASDKWSQAPV